MQPASNAPIPIVIYQSADGSIATEVRLVGETVWLTQKQMAELFGKNTRTVSEHIGNIFKEEELDESSVIRNFRIARQEGSRQVEREIEHYNLDVIISDCTSIMRRPFVCGHSITSCVRQRLDVPYE